MYEKTKAICDKFEIPYQDSIFPGKLKIIVEAKFDAGVSVDDSNSLRVFLDHPKTKDKLPQNLLDILLECKK